MTTLSRWPKASLLGLFTLTAVGFALMLYFEGSSASDCSRVSQLQLQFAWSASAADRILRCWGPAGVAAVVKGIYADYLFLSGYAPLLAMLTLNARERYLDGGWIHGRGLLVSRTQLVAGLLDAIENLMLLVIIHELLNARIHAPVVLVATAKFIFIALGLGYIVGAWSSKFLMRDRGLD